MKIEKTQAAGFKYAYRGTYHDRVVFANSRREVIFYLLAYISMAYISALD